MYVVGQLLLDAILEWNYLVFWLQTSCGELKYD